VLLGAIALLAAVEVCLVFTGSVLAYGAALLAFFVAFNVLEAMLPSLVTRVAPAHARGTAIGVYNTTQTLGLFFGGLLGGWVAEHYGPAALFAGCATLSALWLAAASAMRPPPAPVNGLSRATL
jgi:predicted MFS family arabinose efflux permease